MDKVEYDLLYSVNSPINEPVDEDYYDQLELEQEYDPCDEN
jgi:hypothetical protein